MFFKRRGAPEWAMFFSDDEWREFETVVRAEITPRGISGDIRDGRLSYGKAKYGLGNLAQMCKAQPIEQWPEIVARHFELTVNLPDGLDGTPKLRLVDEGFMAVLAEQDPEPRMTWRVADDLQLVLSFDTPDHVVTPRRAEVLERGDSEAMFAEAIENTRAEPGLELQRHEVPAGEDTFELFWLTGDSFFTATHVLWADQFDPPASEHGTLVAVPNRHVVLAHPIRDKSMLAAVGHMLDLARRLEQAGPGSISQHLYWLREGELERLDAWIDDHAVQFAPGPELIEVLDAL